MINIHTSKSISRCIIRFLHYSAGGPWHITDMRRGESIFELDLNAHEEVESGFEVEGSNLSGVSARCSWAEQDFSELDIVNFNAKRDEHVEDPRLKASFPPQFHLG